jgi:Flp pilus assembly protein TadD
VQDIRQALSLNSRHFGALSGLGIILEELGYDDRALAAYRAVQAIHPHRPNVEEAIDRLVLKVSGPET